MADTSELHNPYVGPQPFQQEDQKRFFGRDREANELLSLVIANRICLMYAQSGAGKSSLLNARLFPMLQEREFEVLPVARVRGLIPDNIPLNKVANPYVLNALISWSDTNDNLDTLTHLSLGEFLNQIPHKKDSEDLPAPRIIIFDQFEELFTAYPERWKDRRVFFNQIVEAIQGGPLFFRPEDIKAPEVLFATLQNRDNPLSYYLFPQFSGDMQELLQTISPVGGIDQRHVEQLAYELNRLVRRQQLFREDQTAEASVVAQTELLLDNVADSRHAKNLNRLIRANNFATGVPIKEMAFSESLEALIASKPRGKSLHKLNRMLLEQAYPNNLPQTAPGDPLLRVLFVMREDFIAQLDPYIPDIPGQLRSRFRMMRLQQRAALEAVKNPLDDSPRSFAPGVAEKLVDELLKINVETEQGEVVELKGEYVEPVQLQVVCENLWHDLPAEVLEITEDHITEFGNVNEALATFYESTLKATIDETGISEGVLRRFFARTLLTPAGTRGTVYRGSGTTGEIPNEAIDVLENRHIIRGEWRGGSRWYELTHDRFIEPIISSNDNWLASQGGGREVLTWLEEKANKWQDNNKQSRDLLTQAELIRAESWLQSPVAQAFDIDPQIQIFISESRKNADASTIQRERTTARRYRFTTIGFLVTSVIAALMFTYAFYKLSLADERLEEANIRLENATEQQELAEINSSRANTERQKAQEAMQLALVEREQAQESEREAIIAKNLAEEAEAVANSREREARRQLRAAQDSLSKANQIKESAEEYARVEEEKIQEAIEEVETQRKDIEETRTTARKELNQALALTLSDEALRLLEAGNDTLSALLAKKAYEYSLDGDTRHKGQIYEALRYTVNVLTKDEEYPRGGPATISTFSSPVNHVAFTPRGGWVLAAANNEPIRAINLDSRQLLSFGNKSDRVSCLQFNQERQEVAVCKAGQNPSFWRFSRGELQQSAFTLPNAHDARDLRYSPDGKAIAFISSSGKMYRWINDGTEAPKSKKRSKKSQAVSIGQSTIMPKSESFTAMATSSDGKYLVASDTQGRIFVWTDWAQGEPAVHIFPATQKAVTTIEFAPDNVTFATGGEDTLIRIHQLSKDGAGLSLLAELQGNFSPITSLSYSPDGSSLASGARDGMLHVREVDASQIPEETPTLLKGQGPSVYSIHFNPDNTYLATGGASNALTLWVPSSATLAQEICDILDGRRLTQEEWNVFVGDTVEINSYQNVCQ